MKKSLFKSFFSISAVFLFCVLITQDVQAAPAFDISEPININGYDVDIAAILAEDSLLWSLLGGFSRIDGNFSQCVADTTDLVNNNETEMRALFPWIWDGEDISYGVDTFCYILAEIPGLAQSQMMAAGLTFGKDGGTNIFDPGVVSDWHNINGLVFDHPLGTIEFTGKIDLLSYDFVFLLLSFAEAFSMDQAFVSLDSDLINGLKSMGAVITMKNVPNFEEPVILVDGKINEDIISAFVYDKEAKTITFNTAHFTSFQAVELSSVQLEEDDDYDDCSKKYKNKSYKQDWEKVKDMKRQSHPEYLKRKMIYKTYKVSGDKAKQQLKINDPETYQLYKEYRRYKKYKKYKECKN